MSDTLTGERMEQDNACAAPSALASASVVDLLFIKDTGEFTSLFYFGTLLALSYVLSFGFLVMRYFKVVQENEMKDVEMKALERVLAVVVDKMKELEETGGEQGERRPNGEKVEDDNDTGRETEVFSSGTSRRRCIVVYVCR